MGAMKYSAVIILAMVAGMAALAAAHRDMPEQSRDSAEFEGSRADLEDSTEVVERRRRLAQAAEGGAVVLRDAATVFQSEHEAVACVALFSQAIRESAELGASVGSVILGTSRVSSCVHLLNKTVDEVYKPTVRSLRSDISSQLQQRDQEVQNFMNTNVASSTQSLFEGIVEKFLQPNGQPVGSAQNKEQAVGVLFGKESTLASTLGSIVDQRVADLPQGIQDVVRYIGNEQAKSFHNLQTTKSAASNEFLFLGDQIEFENSIGTLQQAMSEGASALKDSETQLLNNTSVGSVEAVLTQQKDLLQKLVKFGVLDEQDNTYNSILNLTTPDGFALLQDELNDIQNSLSTQFCVENLWGPINSYEQILNKASKSLAAILSLSRDLTCPESFFTLTTLHDAAQTQCEFSCGDWQTNFVCNHECCIFFHAKEVALALEESGLSGLAADPVFKQNCGVLSVMQYFIDGANLHLSALDIMARSEAVFQNLECSSATPSGQNLAVKAKEYALSLVNLWKEAFSFPSPGTSQNPSYLPFNITVAASCPFPEALDLFKILPGRDCGLLSPLEWDSLCCNPYTLSDSRVQCDSCIASALPCCEVSGGEEQGNFIAQVKGPQGAKCYLQNDIESCTWDFVDNFKPQGDAIFGKTQGPNQLSDFEEMILTTDSFNKFGTMVNYDLSYDASTVSASFSFKLDTYSNPNEAGVGFAFAAIDRSSPCVQDESCHLHGDLIEENEYEIACNGYLETNQYDLHNSISLCQNKAKLVWGVALDMIDQSTSQGLTSVFSPGQPHLVLVINGLRTAWRRLDEESGFLVNDNKWHNVEISANGNETPGFIEIVVKLDGVVYLASTVPLSKLVDKMILPAFSGRTGSNTMKQSVRQVSLAGLARATPASCPRKPHNPWTFYSPKSNQECGWDCIIEDHAGNYFTAWYRSLGVASFALWSVDRWTALAQHGPQVVEGSLPNKMLESSFVYVTVTGISSNKFRCPAWTPVGRQITNDQDFIPGSITVSLLFSIGLDIVREDLQLGESSYQIPFSNTVPRDAAWEVIISQSPDGQICRVQSYTQTGAHIECFGMELLWRDYGPLNLYYANENVCVPSVFDKPEVDPFDLLDPEIQSLCQNHNSIFLIPNAQGIPVVQSGTSGDDCIFGTNGVDVINGLEGDDILFGFAGDDIFYGGPGDDTIYGGSGDDVLSGQKDKDTLYGETGKDVVVGGLNIDKLYGGPQVDKFYGCQKELADFVSSGPGTDKLILQDC